MATESAARCVPQRDAALNDLDAVTEATPPGNKPEYVTAMVPAELAANGPLTAWIEVSLEHANELMAAIEEIHGIFWATKDRDVAWYTAG